LAANTSAVGSHGMCRGFFAHSALDFNLHVPANAALFFVLCALADSLPSRSEPSKLGFVTEPMKKAPYAVRPLKEPVSAIEPWGLERLSVRRIQEIV
jgi:hypothetical protein